MGYASHKDATISEAYDLAKRAIAMDERNEYAHWVLGFIHLMLKNHHMAVMELERAVELNPNCSLAYGTLGTVLSFSGEPEKSIINNEIAIRLNPMNPSIFFRFSGIAMAHFDDFEIKKGNIGSPHGQNERILHPPVGLASQL